MSVFRPKFLFKNLIDDITQLSDSVGSQNANKFRLFDRSDDLSYVSAGATTGTRTITWTPSGEKILSRIVLLGVNWKDFTIKFNGASNFTPTIARVGNQDKHIYIEVAAQAVTNIIFNITATFTASDVVRAKEIIISNEIMEFSGTDCFDDDFRITPAQKAIFIEKSDGTFQKSFVRTTRGASIRCTIRTEAERLKFWAVYEENRRNYVIFIPKPRTQPDIFDGVLLHAHWMGGRSFEDNSNGFEVNGFDGAFSLVPA